MSPTGQAKGKGRGKGDNAGKPADAGGARQAFGARLRAALAAAGIDARAPLVLAAMRLRGGSNTITIYAVRKWLAGQAIPSQHSVRMLADWLAVEPGYLRFGEGQPPTSTPPLADPQPGPTAALDGGEQQSLQAALAQLDRGDRQLVAQLITLLRRRGGTP